MMHGGALCLEAVHWERSCAEQGLMETKHAGQEVLRVCPDLMLSLLAHSVCP